ncbi:uncharacterized protein LOC107262995 [Cephus cinctus]|uniref:Uncharacterized protein LOC107262995 n=1 Tax=Cephus cinctus TaxID=211228 RepID=A0AAJ7BH60_CEPCN|nr:uncharacterized protein LOC107262995 [Cephus cinctus]
MIYLSTAALLLCAASAQGEGYLYIDDCYITESNEEYFDLDKSTVTVNEVNDTYNTMNLKMIIISELPEDVRVELSIWEEIMGEYTIPAGFDISLPICEMLDEPLIGASFLKAVGFTKDNCPPLPGEYGNPSYFPLIQNLLPPSLPHRKYMVSFALLLDDELLLKAEIFIVVN